MVEFKNLVINLKEFVGKYRNRFLVMGLMLNKVIIILFLLFGITGCLPKPKPRTGDFNAMVIDDLTGEAIPGVRVLIGEKEYSTNLKGQFSMAGLSPDNYQIKMNRAWYEPKAIVYKHLGKPAPVHFYLKPERLYGRIYYSYDEGKNKEIYELILSNRLVNKVLSIPGSSETNPTWSMAGKLGIESDSNGSKIFLYDVFEGKPGKLSDQSLLAAEHPSLDNTGTNMVCKKKSESGLAIVLYDLRNNKQVIEYSKSGYNPVISPDGKMVAYVSGNYTKLYIIEDLLNPDKSLREFSLTGYKFNNPCFSPDGSKIVFEAYEKSDGARAIYCISVKPLATEMWQITFPLREIEQHKHPTWSADNIIYFSGNIIYSSRNDIYAVRFNESSNLNNNPWIMVSKGSGNKLYPCWGN